MNVSGNTSTLLKGVRMPLLTALLAKQTRTGETLRPRSLQFTDFCSPAEMERNYDVTTILATLKLKQVGGVFGGRLRPTLPLACLLLPLV